MRPLPTAWPTVSAPTYGFASMKWLVTMSDGSVRRFTRRSDAESLIERKRPSVKTQLRASMEATNG